jgi:endoglucanase
MQIHAFERRLASRARMLAALPIIIMTTTAATPRTDPPASAILAEARLWVDPASAARRQVDAWRDSRPADARLLEKIADQPQAVWFGDWNGDVRRDVDRTVDAARSAGALPVLVAYNIPLRDCGSYSAGGADAASSYRRWIRDFAAGIGGRTSLVVLEPDALAGADCLDQTGRDQRLGLLKDAVATLKAAGALVYIDAGHARWHSPEEIAGRLREAGIALADGFALNVSNFHSNSVNVAYGERVSALTGGKHFVVDSSRNGLGTTSAADWCNPAGQALGTFPSTRTAHDRLDAFLWIKRPGESDGTCNGGPPAGQWWAAYALGLAEHQNSAMAVAMVR